MSTSSKTPIALAVGEDREVSSVDIFGVEGDKSIDIYAKSARKNRGDRARMADQLFAVNYLAFYTFSPSADICLEVIEVNGKDFTRRELHTGLKRKLHYTYSAKDQAIHDMVGNGRTGEQIATKRAITQEISSTMRDVRDALNRREEAANPSGAGSTTRELDVRLTDALNKAKAAAQKADKPKFDVTAFVKTLNTGLAILAK